MIMELDIKGCPFRKRTMMTNYHNGCHGNAPVDTVYEEDFLECIESKCMAWHQKTHSCLIMNERIKKEED